MSTRRAHKSSPQAGHKAWDRQAHEAHGTDRQQVLRQAGAPLPPALRRHVEARFGHDFSAVRIHTDQAAAQSAGALAAKAYTVGNHIVFGAGRFSPQGCDSQRLLAHELAHVVQQRRGGAAPALEAGASHEQEAARAADAVAAGASSVAVAGATGVGVACAKDDEEEKTLPPPSQASMTVLMQRRQAGPPLLNEPVRLIDDPNKGKGVQAEVTMPFDRYAGWDWNHIGGGSETASSRTNLARQSSADVRLGQEGTAGLDYLVENVRTDRLVIGEQKATRGGEFSSTTAITTSLETNLGHTIATLERHVASGAVTEPAEVVRLERTIQRLRDTQAALETGRAGKPAELPPGVVFELTNVGGEGEKIGKEHLDLLAERYGGNPAFLEHLLDRTFVRDKALAAKKGRDAGGERGTDADPDIVPAADILTDPAKDELARLRAGKTEKQWQALKAKQKRETQSAQRKQRAAEKKAQRQQRASEESQARKLARQAGEQARRQQLEHLRAQQREAAEQPRTKRQRQQVRRTLKRRAAAAGKQVEKTQIGQFLDTRKQFEAQQRAQRKAAERAAKDARKAQRQADATLRKERAEAAARQKQEGQRKALESGTLETPAKILEINQRARESHEAATRRQALGGKILHGANQFAAGVRAVDAYDEALERGEGQLEASARAGITYLENTNPVVGAIATVEGRMRKDESGRQYYGDDAVDAWLGTIGETGAGYLVPGSAWDQAVNAAANVSGAVDDHLQRSRDPNDPGYGKANLRTFTDVAADATPSRLAAQAAGGGLRALYDVGRAARGDTKGVEKFSEDALQGKLGAAIQPWAMAGDFAANLASDDVGTALEKTVKKTEGTALTKLGYASGEAMYDLGQNERVKAGNSGMVAQGWSMLLGIASDQLAGRDLERSLQSASDASRGSLAHDIGSTLGDKAYDAYEAGDELFNEDLPAAKKKVGEKLDAAKRKLAGWWRSE